MHALPPAMQRPLTTFLTAMECERGLAPNTLDAYRRDLVRYLHDLIAQGVGSPAEARQQHVTQLLRTLQAEGLRPSTLARNTTSLKRFHQFLVVQGLGTHDPTEHVDAPRLERRIPEFLSVAEPASWIAMTPM